MSFYDEELKQDIQRILDNQKFIVDNNQEIYFNLLETMFPIRNGRIDWSKTLKPLYQKASNDHLINDTVSFVKTVRGKYPVLQDEQLQLIYFGDGLTELVYKFQFHNFEKIVPAILTIPQHHYFIPENAHWCICISFENDLDFGFSPNP